MTGKTRLTADIATVLGNGGKRGSSAPEGPQEADEHEAAEDE
jgi:hypothetical protein